MAVWFQADIKVESRLLKKQSSKTSWHEWLVSIMLSWLELVKISIAVHSIKYGLKQNTKYFFNLGKTWEVTNENQSQLSSPVGGAVASCTVSAHAVWSSQRKENISCFPDAWSLLLQGGGLTLLGLEHSLWTSQQLHLHFLTCNSLLWKFLHLCKMEVKEKEIK